MGARSRTAFADGALIRPLRIAFDLPAVEGVAQILRSCATPFALSIEGPHEIGHGLTRFWVAVPQQKQLYLALIECLARINELCLTIWPFPPLYESGVTYAEEPAGQEVWQSVAALYLRGEGDCEDLVAALIAQLRAHGENAWARMDLAKVRSKGRGRLFHFRVQRPATIEDPSLMLGMR